MVVLGHRRAALAELLVLAGWFGLICGLVEGVLLWGFQALGWLSWEMSLRSVDARIIPVAVAVDTVVFATLASAPLWLGRTVKAFPAVPAAVALFTALTAYDWLAVTLSGRLAQYALGLMALGAAAVAYRRSSGSTQLPTRWTRRSLGWIIGLGAVIPLVVQGPGLVAERFEERALPPAGTNAPNILVIILDAVRADHLSAYDYIRTTSPEIDLVAQRGVLFENAFATSSWTLPSHASLFTGRTPHEHGAEWCAPLDERYPTVGEVLQEEGYRTGGFSANMLFFTRSHGLARGFLHFEDVMYSATDMLSRTLLGRLYDKAVLTLAAHSRVRASLFDPVGLRPLGRPKLAAEVTRATLDWIDRDPTRPFFAVLNLFDAHGPELAPEPYREMFSSRKQPFGRLERLDWRGRKKLSDEQLRYLVDTYDGAIAYMDHHVGRLLDSLAVRGFLDRTIVVVTSDHGEMFLEHGRIGHRLDLWTSEIRVPLIMAGPGVAPRVRIAASVSQTALPPTIIELAGSTHSGIFPELSLPSLWDTDATEGNDTRPYPLAQLARYPPPPPGRAWPQPGWTRSLLTPRWHYIRQELRPERLYDRLADPGEQRDVSLTPEGRAALAALRPLLDRRVPAGSARGEC